MGGDVLGHFLCTVHAFQGMSQYPTKLHNVIVTLTGCMASRHSHDQRVLSATLIRALGLLVGAVVGQPSCTVHS